jgi:hypothetical protein
MMEVPMTFQKAARIAHKIAAKTVAKTIVKISGKVLKLA